MARKCDIGQYLTITVDPREDVDVLDAIERLINQFGIPNDRKDWLINQIQLAVINHRNNVMTDNNNVIDPPANNIIITDDTLLTDPIVRIYLSPNTIHALLRGNKGLNIVGDLRRYTSLYYVGRARLEEINNLLNASITK